jgi:hypothetical protein
MAGKTLKQLQEDYAEGKLSTEQFTAMKEAYRASNRERQREHRRRAREDGDSGQLRESVINVPRAVTSEVSILAEVHGVKVRVLMELALTQFLVRYEGIFAADHLTADLAALVGVTETDGPMERSEKVMAASLRPRGV